MGTPLAITVAGTILDGGGAGKLVWASYTLLHDSESDDVVSPHEIIVPVGADGEFSVPILSTDDPQFSPTGWTWEVRAHFPNWRDTFSVSIPYDTPGGTLDFSLVAPVAPDGTGDLYALVNHTHSGGGGSGASPSGTVGSSLTFGQSAAAGASANYSRGDHVHGSPSLGTSGSTAAAGNHNHSGVYDASGAAASAQTAAESYADSHDATTLASAESYAAALVAALTKSIVLGPTDPIPGGTASGTIVVRTT